MKSVTTVTYKTQMNIPYLKVTHILLYKPEILVEVS